MSRPSRIAWAVTPRRERASLAASVALNVLERVSLAAAALTLAGEGGVLWSGALVAAATALYAARRHLRVTARAEVEAELQRRSVAAVLARAPYAPREVGEGDAQTAAAEGAYAGSVLVAEALPGALGDAIAACVVGVALAMTQPPRTVAIGAAALAGALAVAAASRGSMRAREREVVATYEPVVEHLRAAIEGRVEIANAGAEGALRASMGAVTRAHTRSVLLAARVGAMLGRAPVVLGVGLALLGLAVDGSLSALASEGAGAALSRAAPIAAGLPPFLGALAAAMQATRAEVTFEPLSRWLSSNHEAGPTGRVPLGAGEVSFVALSARYPGARVDALAPLDAVWPADRILLVVGANGAGKSTLLRLLAGLLPVAAGTLETADGPVRGGERLDGSTVAYLPQEPWLGDLCSVRQAFRWLSPDLDDDAIRAALSDVRLLTALEAGGEPPLDVRVSSLSAGQRQRVALARLFAREAAAYVLDEPDTNLDAQGVELLAERILARARERRVVVAAHSPRLIAALAPYATELPL